MKTSMQNVSEVLGPELIRVFKESCGTDKQALDEMIGEAMRALFQVKKEGGWRNYELSDYQE